MLTFLLVLLAAVAFEYINGFHDAANAIATVVSTKVMTPRQAIMMAAVANLVGAFGGVAVAKTIASGYIDSGFQINQYAVLAALSAGIVWNLVTWLGGIPSSSSHALIGGLCGAAMAQFQDWSCLVWDGVKETTKDGVTTVEHFGLWPKLVKPMFISPVLGFALGWAVMFLLTALIVRLAIRPSLVQKAGGKMQIASAAFMGFSHGSNDAQKTMGIITLAVVAAASGGAFHDLPMWMQKVDVPSFMQSWHLPEVHLHLGKFHLLDIAGTPLGESIPLLTDAPKDAAGKPMPHGWVILLCALTMAAGTAAGGWKIIKTMGHKMVKLQPVHGFAAEAGAASIIVGASGMGIPLSTTHVISTSIMGVGAMKRLSAVKWGLVQRIVWAWVLTLPITGLLGYFAMKAFLLMGLGK